MEKHLYIIGNGFDIHHGIPSKYYDKKGGSCFRKWLDENNCELLCEIDENFGSTNESWWSKFEDSLASIETLRVANEEAFEHYPNFGSDDFRDRDWYEAELSVGNRLNNVYSNIISAFRNWINQLPIGNPQMKVRIEMTNSSFLTFNYSDTLETLYGVSPSSILYIHGKVKSNDALILGHGLTYQDLEKEFEKNEKVDGGDYVYQRAKSAALFSVANHRKKVEEIIKKNKKWFDELFDVTQIHIYGHSLNEIDMPYFQKIFDTVNRNNVKLEISYLDEKDYENVKKIMEYEGFSISQYKPIRLKDLQIST